jgi:hypothetical protein
MTNLESDNSRVSGRSRQWLRNPAIWITIIIAAANIMLGIFVYPHISEKHTELLFAVSPGKASIATVGQSTGFEVLFSGTNIGNNDVSAAQAAIWNSGDTIIKKEDILSEIVIYSEPTVKILEAKITKNNGDPEITGLAINNSLDNMEKGRIPVIWNNIAKEEGLSLQIIYEGNLDVKIKAKGRINSFGDIKQVEPKENITWPFILLIIMNGIMNIMSTALPRNIIFPKFFKIALIANNIVFGALMLIIFVSYTKLFSNPPTSFGPPFGF